MDSTFILILGCWLLLNLVAVPLIGRRITRRRAAAACTIHTDGYASVLLSRLAVQTCRLLGAERACVLVREQHNADWLIAAVGHGLAEEALGQRVRVGGLLRTALDGGAQQCADAHRMLPALGAGTAVASGCRSVVLCTATADGRREYGPAEKALLGDLAELCAAAVDDLRIRDGLDAKISSGAGELTALESRTTGTGAQIDPVALARRVGERLGLEPAALVELDLASSARPEAAKRLSRLPGFEAVELIVRFTGERWDGRGRHGLPGDRIPLASRILAACRALDALTRQSSSGRVTTVDEALRRIMSASGTVFDPTVVAALSHELLGEVPAISATVEEDEWARADAQYAAVL